MGCYVSIAVYSIQKYTGSPCLRDLGPPKTKTDKLTEFY